MLIIYIQQNISKQGKPCLYTPKTLYHLIKVLVKQKWCLVPILLVNHSLHISQGYLQSFSTRSTHQSFWTFNRGEQKNFWWDSLENKTGQRKTQRREQENRIPLKKKRAQRR